MHDVGELRVLLSQIVERVEHVGTVFNEPLVKPDHSRETGRGGRVCLEHRNLHVVDWLRLLRFRSRTVGADEKPKVSRFPFGQVNLVAADSETSRNQLLKDLTNRVDVIFEISGGSNKDVV